MKIELLECACGCGQKRLSRMWGRNRRYITGHNRTHEDGFKEGANHPFWKGGKLIDGNGYVLIKYRQHHPRNNKKGYVKEHVLVMEQHIGRFLRPDEVIHHINGIRSDNRIENLKLMTKNEHNRQHAIEQHRLGLLESIRDPETGKYQHGKSWISDDNNGKRKRCRCRHMGVGRST